MNSFLYLSIILLWGFTWIAIKNQVGVVPIEISLIYRFGLAAAIIGIVMLLKQDQFKFSLKQHAMMALFGSLFFSTNFFFFYNAAHYLTSGLMAIILSTSVIMIMINNALFLRKKIQLNMLLGGIIGLSGLGLIFWPELEVFSLTDHTILGLLLSLLGAYCFAWANYVSTLCTRMAIPLISSTFYGMLYGVILLNIFCFIMHIPYGFDIRPSYIYSLLYLAIPGSVLGFLTYLTLVKRVGAEKAVYATFFFPIVALIVSTYVEAFTWIPSDFIGVVLVIFGNIMVVLKFKAYRQTRPS